MEKAKPRFTVVRVYQVIDNTIDEVVDEYKSLAAAKEYAQVQNDLALDEQAVDILADANMGKGYTDRVATRAARLAVAAIPLDIRAAIEREIVAGKQDTIDLYRWPLCSCQSAGNDHASTCALSVIRQLFAAEDAVPSKPALLSPERAAEIRKQSQGGAQ